MTQTDLSDVHSVTPLEANEAAAGLCEMTADRQTSTDFPSGLSCQQQMRYPAMLACCYFENG